MNKNLKNVLVTAVSVAAGVLLVTSMIEIRDLRQDIAGLRQEGFYDSEQMNDRISAIYGNVDAMMQRKENELAAYDWEFGEPDFETRTVPLTCTALPKEFSPGITEVTILHEGKTYPMTYDGFSYTVVMDLPVFRTTGDFQVRMNDGGRIRAQALDWKLIPGSEYLYSGSVDWYFEPDWNEEDEVWTVASGFNVKLEREEKFRITEMELVEVLNGREIGRMPVDLSEEAQKRYAEHTLNVADPRLDSEQETDAEKPKLPDTAGSYVFYLQKDYPLRSGSMLELYLDVTDSDGLRSRFFVECFALGQDGKEDVELIHTVLNPKPSPVEVYGPDGKLCYRAADELEK